MTQPTAKEVNIQAPLAAFKGDKPEAPRWFEQALQRAPERSVTDAGGTPIETLTWGERGKPGLLLLHGNRAHADWWSFIAPFFADDYRVAALSWSGMGGSGWRDTYSIDTFASEIGAVIDATGLLDGPTRPVLVAHSFGGYPALRFAARNAGHTAGLVMVDSPIMTREMRDARRRPGATSSNDPRPTRVYDDLPAALARFRLMPPQVCKNLYIADHIARGALKQVPREDAAAEGWTWRFDPYQWRDMRMQNPVPDVTSLRCPLAIMWGAQSALFDADVLAYIASLVPAGTPRIEIPAARHHLMIDQPLAFVTALRGLLAAWPR